LDAAGNESTFMSVKVFVAQPKQCKGRDCLGCEEFNFKAKNSYTAIFSEIDAKLLSFKCTACDTADEENAFVRILPEAFYEKELSTLTIGGNTSVDNKIPIKFCLIQACNDDIATKCRWENTFYVPALTNKCKGFGCEDGLEKILLAMTVSLEQSEEGWTLEAYAAGPDCKKLQIFRAAKQGSPCVMPVRFLNDLPFNEEDAGTYTSTSTVAGYSKNSCAIFPPEEIKFTTGTISCAMSPDLGTTWFQYRGVIRIRADRKAVKPFIVHDDKMDLFHLFWTERDMGNENARGVAATTGFDAYLKHKVLDARYFTEEDAFVDFFPAPEALFGESSSSGDNPADYPKDPFFVQQWKNLSERGRLLRQSRQNIVQYEERVGAAGTSSFKQIFLTDEYPSAYIDRYGRLQVVRFGVSNTLVDPPDRLTRRRRRRAKCGKFTWIVSGITDTDCGCQSLLGAFELEQTRIGYEHPKWTLTPTDDYKEWEMTSINGMLTFRRKRGITQCPPNGAYSLVCNRCSGFVTATLQATRVQIYGNDEAIDNGDLPANFTQNTDFGNVVVNLFKENDFVIRNIRSIPLALTGTPRVEITGADASLFAVVVNAPGTVAPQSQATFTIQFKPDSVGAKYAGVRIVTDDEDSPYVFNLKGTGVAAPTGSSGKPVIASEAPGILFSADSVGTILVSSDGGVTWDSQKFGIKAGQEGALVYDELGDVLYSLYVSDDMLFARRYPSLIYSQQVDPTRDADEAFDGLNIVNPPEIIIPNTDVLQGGIPTSIADFLSLPTYFNLPNLQIPGSVLDTLEEDFISKKTKLENEKDPKGIPIFLVGNKEGALINAHFPYPKSFSFDAALTVAAVKPAAYITRDGAVRFFYVDAHGYLNGGIVTSEVPTLDTKLKG
jgi:hypothetical protein